MSQFEPTHEVAVKSLRLRAEPTTGAEILREMAFDQAVQKLEEAGRANGYDWWKVRLPIGFIELDGYVAAKFLDVFDDLDETPGGSAGALTLTVPKLRDLAPNAKDYILEGLEARGNPVLAEYGVSANPLRFCHFLAQIGHESAHFRTLYEYGGRSYFTRYDGRSDLGNTEPGDGFRYRGRGFIQLTGRFNYRKFGPRVGLDLESEPERAADPEVALRLACLYWTDRGLNDVADDDNIRLITRRINGGYNGLQDREKLYRRARRIWG